MPIMLKSVYSLQIFNYFSKFFSTYFFIYHLNYPILLSKVSLICYFSINMLKAFAKFTKVAI